jgi:hypothetical protein
VAPIESDRLRLERDEAPDHQRGAEQEHQRQGHFADDEHTPQPRVPTTGATAAPPFLQGLVQIRERRLQRGGQPKEQPRRHRYAGGEQEDPGVNREVHPERPVGGDRPIDPLVSPQREGESGGGAQQGQEHALREQLTHDASPTRAERCPDGDLALPGGGAR